MLKIGVLGAGHLGKIHIKLLLGIPEFELVGFYDPDPEKASFAENTYGIPSFKIIEALMDAVDVVDIVTPTLSHYDCAKKAIAKGKHIFVEKPLSHTVEEAKELVALAKSANVKGMVGHVERFNPAFMAAQQYDLQPLFIEGHRLAEFKPRGTDVSVILDLMIHDIDIILSMVKSKVSQVSASGVAVISDKIDIANARIEFENGCVANLTSSRVSLKTERKLRIFQKNAYISIDFQKKETNVFQLKELEPGEKAQSEIVIDPGEGKPLKEIFYDQPEMREVNAIEYELQLFANAIINDEQPPVNLQAGYNAMVVAHDVLQKIDDLLKKSELKA